MQGGAAGVGGGGSGIETPTPLAYVPVGRLMSLQPVLASPILAKHILSYVVNFWEVPRFATACKTFCRALAAAISEFHGAYLQLREHLCDVDERRQHSRAVARYDRLGVIF